MTFAGLLRWFSLAAVIVVAAAIVERVVAGGIPSKEALSYAGVLLNAEGGPLTGEYNVQINFWSTSETAGEKPACQTRSIPVRLGESGRFSVPLEDECIGVVQEHADLWVEVSVNGSSLGLARVGAVPYAIEAGHATSADSVRAGAPLDRRLNALMPPKTIVSAYLSAEEVVASFDETGLGKSDTVYAGWAICNGENGTPDLDGRFARMSTVAAGAVGGTDDNQHTHAIDHDHPRFSSDGESGHTHQAPAHNHLMPIGFDRSNQFWVSNGAGDPAFGSTVLEVPRAAPGVGSMPSGLARLAYTDNGGAANTTPGSEHAHAVDPPALSATSGPASTTDNRPAFIELVALMRL